MVNAPCIEIIGTSHTVHEYYYEDLEKMEKRANPNYQVFSKGLTPHRIPSRIDGYFNLLCSVHFTSTDTRPKSTTRFICGHCV